LLPILFPVSSNNLKQKGFKTSTCADMNGTTSTSHHATDPVQEKVAKYVTVIVLVGTCVFGTLGVIMAMVSLINEETPDNSKDILQILLSAILPLFGTWIGTILAFYFSRENLLAANQTVRHLVDTITSDKKLQSIKARGIMIPVEKLKYKEYKTGTDDSKINLKQDFLDYIKTNGISRVILLDENKAAKYALHKSAIESFIAEQYLDLQSKAGATTSAQGTATSGGGSSSSQGQPATNAVPPKALTFADMKASKNEHIKDILVNGVKFISEDANLSDAKVLMKNYPACNDVFITRTGSPTEPVLGWITDKTIAESSIVN
jgi:hypothetical protein